MINQDNMKGKTPDAAWSVFLTSAATLQILYFLSCRLPEKINSKLIPKLTE